MKIILIGGAALVIVSISWFIVQNKQSLISQSALESKKVSVVATFYPLENFAKKVGGDRIVVTSIVPAGAEPHEYEPTQKDVLSAYQADVFLVNGAGIDPWAEKIRPELEKRGVKVVQMSEFITLLAAEREEAEHEEDGHEESMFDPHFWLDPLLVEKEVMAISESLSARDEAGKAVYAQNASEFLERLRILDEQYRSGLSVCTFDTVVTSHNAFAYMASRYDFSVLPVAGLSPEAETSPRRLAEIATLVKEKGIKYIFFETLVSPRVAETLAQEVGAETLVFNPLEGLTNEERERGEDYVSKSE